MKNSVVMFIFCVFIWRYPCLSKWFQKVRIVCWSWNLKPRLIGTSGIRRWFLFFIFLFFLLKYYFRDNLVQKFEIVSLGWNLIPRLLQICKIRDNVHECFCFRPFLQVLSKKSICHFGVTCWISREFTRRDVKPVAFQTITKVTRRPGRLLTILCTFNLRPVSTGY